MSGSDYRVVPVDEIAGWDDEADVLIAGYGASGICAAIEAVREASS